MPEKTFKGRIVNKHDTEENWLKSSLIPKQGELIVYDKDSTHNYERLKVGDGSTVVSSLPFIDDNKVDKVSGKGLSTNDYTNDEKNKLEGIEAGANKTVVDSALSTTSTNPVQNKAVKAAIDSLSSQLGEGTVSEQIEDAIANKVDKVSGKGLSTNDYTTAEKAKLSGIATGAEVNQNAFANVVVGSTTIAADAKSDSLTLVAGSNVTITPDTTNDKIIIAATDTVYTHPTYTSKNSGLYKITVDGTGHVSGTTAVAKSDITALGIPAQDTTYSAATQSAAGLMSVDDKKTLDTLDTYVGDSSVSSQIEAAKDDCITGLSVSGKVITYTKGDGTTGTITTQDTNTTYTSLKNPNKLTIKGAGASVESYDGSAVGEVDIVAGSNVSITTEDGKIAIAATDTNTHYSSLNTVGASGATSNSAKTNGNVYLNHIENGAKTSSHKITGAGSVTVASDSSGNITITGTDNNTVTTATTTGSGNAVTSVTASNGALTVTKGTTFATKAELDALDALVGDTSVADQIAAAAYTHPSYTARTGKPTANQTPAFGGTATVSQITSDATGHVTAATDRTIKIPDTLSNGTGTAGLIKTSSTVTSNSGYTACPVISGVPYYKDTNTTYSVATTSANGLMSNTDKTKLDGISVYTQNEEPENAPAGALWIDMDEDYTGNVEIYDDTPCIDFHFANNIGDYTSRIIENESGTLHCSKNFSIGEALNVGGTSTLGDITTAGEFRIQSGWIGMYPTNSDAVAASNRYGYLGYDNGTYLRINDSKSGIQIQSAGDIRLGTLDAYKIGLFSDGSEFRPVHNNYIVSLGNSDYKWGAIYSVNGTIQTSDRNQKEDIVEIDDKYIQLFDKLQPVTFKLVGAEHDRTHVGFISQDVKSSMDEIGLTDIDFAGYCRDIKTEYDEETQQSNPVYDDDGNLVYNYSLRYSEFVALNTKMIQMNRAKIAKQQEEIDNLKAEIEVLKTTVSELLLK